MPQGTIKKKTDKGFGFISVEGREDLFFHMSATNNQFDNLSEGQAVTFDIGTNPRDGRERAENVTAA
jgi:CspA family cold shock protein